MIEAEIRLTGDRQVLPSSTMDFSELEKKLRASFQQSPGRIFAGEGAEAMPSAAVCAILRDVKIPTGPELLLVKRVVSPRDPWSGQMAFPGGRSRPEESPLDTVIREVNEETKISLKPSELLGPMDQVIPGNRIIKVFPFISFKHKPLVVVSDGIEIVEHFWIPLSFFSDAKNSSQYEFSRNGNTYKVPSFSYLGKNIVWGMTLRIIRNLLERLD